MVGISKKRWIKTPMIKIEARIPRLVFTNRNEKRKNDEIKTRVKRKTAGWIIVLKISNFCSGDTKSKNKPIGKSDIKKRYKNGKNFLCDRILTKI